MKQYSDNLMEAERLLGLSRQQVAALEGQLEQSQENEERLKMSLNTSQLNLQELTDQLGRLQETFSGVQQQLADSRTKVRYGRPSVGFSSSLLTAGPR